MATPPSTPPSTSPAPGTWRGPDAGLTLATAVLAVVSGAVVVVGLLVVGGGAAPSTIADPGPLTTTGLPLARYAQDLLGVLAVGAALTAVLAHRTPDVVRRSLRALTATSAAWAVVTAVVYVLTASDLSGRTVAQVLTPQVQRAFLSLPQARAHLLVLLAAVMLLVAARVLLRDGDRLARAAGDGDDGAGGWVAPPVSTSAVLLLLATGALVPPTFAGHSAAAEDHELAVASLSVHLVAGAMWVGGLALLAALVLADRRVPVPDATAVTASFSTLALWCVVVVGASGVLNASLRVTSPEQLLSTGYGVLLLVKTVGLVVLVGFGYVHRTRSIARAVDGAGRRAFVRLVAVELVVMVLVVATAVALARTPPPAV